MVTQLISKDGRLLTASQAGKLLGLNAISIFQLHHSKALCGFTLPEKPHTFWWRESEVRAFHAKHGGDCSRFCIKPGEHRAMRKAVQSKAATLIPTKNKTIN